MKFTAAVVLALATTASAFAPPASKAFAPRATSTRIFHSTETEAAASETEQLEKLTKKQERLRMMESDRFYRKGFKDTREDVQKTMSEQFESNIVEDLKTNNYVMERDGVKVYLAKVCRLPICSGASSVEGLASVCSVFCSEHVSFFIFFIPFLTAHFTFFPRSLTTHIRILAFAGVSNGASLSPTRQSIISLIARSILPTS